MALYSLSLCAGIGGLDLSIELACPGVFTPAALVEGEAYAAAILAARMEDKAMAACPIWADLRTVCDAEFCDYVRERTGGQGIDFVYGGIPCQPHSVAGKRLGADDERDLWPATVRILETYRPWLFFLENVPGFLGYLSARTIPDLRRLGYVVPRPLLLEAASVGAPQKRERLFVLAYRDGGRRIKHGQSNSDENEGSAKRRKRKLFRKGIDDTDRCDSDVANNPNPRSRRISEPGRRDNAADVDGGGIAVAKSSNDGCRNANRETDRSGRERTEDRPSDVSGGSGRGEDQSDAIAGLADRTMDNANDARRSEAVRGSDERQAGQQGGQCVPGDGRGEMEHAIDGRQAQQEPRAESGGESGSNGAMGIGIGPQGQHEAGAEETAAIGANGSVPYWPPGPAQRDEWQRILAVRPDLAPAVDSPLDRRAIETELRQALRCCSPGRNRRERRRNASVAAHRFAASIQTQTAESEIRLLAPGTSPGMAITRTDELRSLGNLVVPLQGAAAFLILLGRLKEALPKEPQDD